MDERPKAIVDHPAFLQARPPKAVYLDPKTLRPLPQALCGMSCSHCDKRQSVWEHWRPEAPSNAKKGDPMCSLCWLYESAWGKDRREDIDGMIRAVEMHTGEMFRKTDDGRLWSCRDADRILGSIAVTSRIVYQRTMLSRLGGDDGP
jgi:hypothetical protein